MKRRTEGFASGKITVRDVQGWKIARRDRNGTRLNYFAPNAEIAAGLDIHPGTDVVFTPELRDGRWYAVNVQPKPAHMEVSMRHLLLAAAALFLLIASAFVGSQLQNRALAQDAMVGSRIDDVNSWLRRASFYDLVPDSIVRDQIQQRLFKPADGRLVVFGKEICEPILGTQNNYPTDQDEAVLRNENTPCFDLLHSIDEGSDRDFASRTDIPETHYDIAGKLEDLVMEKAREHLKNADNFEAFYYAKKHVALEEIASIQAGERVKYVELGEQALAHMRLFTQDENLRVLRQQYADAEKAWKKAHDAWLEGKGAGSVSDERWDEWKALQTGLLGALQTDKESEKWYWFLYAGRRFDEGGMDLVNAHIATGEDLLADVKAL